MFAASLRASEGVVFSSVTGAVPQDSSERMLRDMVSLVPEQQRGRSHSRCGSPEKSRHRSRKTGGYGTAALPDLSDQVVLLGLLKEHAGKRVEAERRAAGAERKVADARPSVRAVYPAGCVHIRLRCAFLILRI